VRSPAASAQPLTGPPDCHPPFSLPPSNTYRLSEDPTARAAFAHLERKLAALERCTLLVDTRGEGGWRVLWASSTWDALCGAALTREAVLQRSMQDCFASIPAGEELWAEGAECAAAGEVFVLSKVQLVSVGRRSVGDGSSRAGMPYDLIFRPAAAGPLDELAPDAAVASGVAMAGSGELPQLLCVTVMRHARRARAWLLAGAGGTQRLGRLQGEIQGLEVSAWRLLLLMVILMMMGGGMCGTCAPEARRRPAHAGGGRAPACTLLPVQQQRAWHLLLQLTCSYISF
jgi:hypothetical protein